MYQVISPLQTVYLMNWDNLYYYTKYSYFEYDVFKSHHTLMQWVHHQNFMMASTQACTTGASTSNVPLNTIQHS